MMYEEWGCLPAEVGRLTLPQLQVLFPDEKPRTRKMSLAEARKAGLLR